jgi:hypothetical protein
MRRTIATAVLVAVSLAMPAPAQAHTRDALDEWVDEWVDDVQQRGGLNIQALVEWRDMVERHPYYFHPPDPAPRDIPRASNISVPAGVEQWRGLVARYFAQGDVDRALCLMDYESRGDPNATNPRSGAAGLFQHLPKYWAERSSAAGVPGANIYDPEANVAVAAWLRNDGWQHWSPYNRGLCR